MVRGLGSFFFQAEDGIRDTSVTGVQTCALPIYARDPVAVASEGVREAKLTGRDTVLVDTAGRLHIDDALVREIRAVVDAVSPGEVLFVADAMTGQDAVRAASGFAAVLPLTGVILTKTDGDARGGAA